MLLHDYLFKNHCPIFSITNENGFVNANGKIEVISVNLLQNMIVLEKLFHNLGKDSEKMKSL